VVTVSFWYVQTLEGDNEAIRLIPGGEGRDLDRNLRDLKLIPDHDSDDPGRDRRPRVHVRRKRSRRSEG
jgi:hypothetical protein